MFFQGRFQEEELQKDIDGLDRHTVVLLKDIFTDNCCCSFYVSLLSFPQLTAVIFRSRIVMFKRSS